MTALKQNSRLGDKGDSSMKRTISLVLLMSLFLPCPIFADNAMAGKWRASSGYTVHIPDGSGSFVLIFESSTGEKITHPAQWVTVGQEFTWTDKQNSRHTATLQPGNPERICDVNESYPDSHAYWYRVEN